MYVCIISMHVRNIAYIIEVVYKEDFEFVQTFDLYKAITFSLARFTNCYLQRTMQMANPFYDIELDF